MEMLIVLLVASPIALGIWLIVRAISAQNAIAELTRRVDELQGQLAKLKNPASTTPATLPPKDHPESFVPPPLPTVAKTIEAPVAPPKVEAIPHPPAIAAQTESVQPPVVEKASFEMRLGTYWLVRAGIVMLLAGLAFFANYAYHHVVPRLGAIGKISLLYIASGLLLGAGAWWQRRNAKESLKNYAQVLFAGGLAAVYFTTYAAHHIPPLRVIESALLDGTLLLAWAGGIAWVADCRKSEVMAVFAVGLAFFTSVITRVGEFTLYSNLILTVAAVVFLIRNRWATLSFAGLVTSYAGYAFWRFLHENGWRWAEPDERLYFGAIFLACYWLVFTAATFLSSGEKFSGANRAAFLTLNNGAFFALFILTMLQVHAGGFWKVCLGYGAVLLALAGLAKKMLPSEPPAKNAYLTQGLLLVTLGFISKFAGLQLALVLGVESVALFVLGAQRQSDVLKFFAFAAAALATGWCVSNMAHSDSPSLWTGAGLGALLAFNAFWAHRQDARKSSAQLRPEPAVFTLLALAVSLVWIWNLAQERQCVWAYMAAAALVFAPALWRRNHEAFMAAAVFALASLAALWFRDDLEMDIYWPNLIALLTLFALQQILRRATAQFPVDEKIHGAIICLAGASLWRFLTCWVTTDGLFLTMSWAGFALAVFVMGMFLRERFHRWLGLGVLAAAVGRVVLVDVWKQETIYRVLTFMSLGVALLVIGFIYNKYQDTIRKWL